MSIEELDNSPETIADPASRALATQVVAAVLGIRFGSVELVIHEGRVVQIERRERLRLARQAITGKPD